MWIFDITRGLLADGPTAPDPFVNHRWEAVIQIGFGKYFRVIRQGLGGWPSTVGRTMRVLGRRRIHRLRLQQVRLRPLRAEPSVGDRRCARDRSRRLP